ncbi:MAG: hypothetical protein HC936_15530 [Leptolyngbyaceae cyanobacterium SU_3_3]|nr:hypothetical protein [Leptolyngbyaceae cyanobacterium SU_3_3]
MRSRFRTSGAISPWRRWAIGHRRGDRIVAMVERMIWAIALVVVVRSPFSLFPST